MDRILRTEHANFVPGPHSFSPAELVVALYWKDKETGLPKYDGGNMPKGLSKKITTPAHISHSRWVADCPTPGCHAATYVSPEDPRLFCVTCENAAAGGKWVKVEFPENLERIEELLLRRPLPENRNWFPYETIAVIEEENKAHGIDAS